MSDSHNETLNELIAARFGEDLGVAADRPAQGTHAQQLRHRSRRRFTPDPIPEDTLKLLFACALSAPAKSDLQQVSIVRFAEAGLRGRVTDLFPSMPWIKQAPEFLLFCGDGRRIRRVCALRGKSFGHEPLDAFTNAVADAAIVMQNFIVAAEAEGLGCCPISAVREVTDEIVDLAGLPEGVFPFAGLCLGRPDDDPWISLRLPMTLTVHTDRYDDAHLEADIAAYDARRRDANPIRRQRDVDAFGEADVYGWSEDKARQTSHTERRAFGRYVLTNGYPIKSS